MHRRDLILSEAKDLIRVIEFTEFIKIIKFVKFFGICTNKLTEELKMENEEFEDEQFEEEENTEELVPVFSTDHPGIIAIVKSILDEAGIQYLEKGDGLQTLFALGTVQFFVNSENAEIASELLKDIENSDPLTDEPEGFTEFESPDDNFGSAETDDENEK